LTDQLAPLKARVERVAEEATGELGDLTELGQDRTETGSTLARHGVKFKMPDRSGPAM